MYHIHNMSILQLRLQTVFFSTFIFIQSNQTTSSSTIEFMGHQQALTFLLANTAMNITIYITDRHSQITKWMRTECPALQYVSSMANKLLHIFLTAGMWQKVSKHFRTT